MTDKYSLHRSIYIITGNYGDTFWRLRPYLSWFAFLQDFVLEIWILGALPDFFKKFVSVKGKGNGKVTVLNEVPRLEDVSTA
jgi:hypothetical protein